MFPVLFFYCAMARQGHVGEIRRLVDQVIDTAVLCSVRLWDRGHHGSLWFHLSAVINIPPISGNSNITVQSPNGEVVPVILYCYSHFIELDDGWLTIGVGPICCVSPETFTK